MNKLRAIDLFAGIGGIRLGFELTFGKGIKTVFTCEWDKHAQVTYKANFGDEEIAGDISRVNGEDVPSFDICFAGFPCQAFSIEGRKEGFNDKDGRGTLFLDFIDICAVHKPKIIFAENVKHLVNHRGGRSLNMVLAGIEQTGYRTHVGVLNSKDFGVPQNRERVYIVAFRDDIDSSKFQFPAPTDKTQTIADIMETAPVPSKYYLSQRFWDALKRHKERMQVAGNGFGYIIRTPNDIAATITVSVGSRDRSLLIDKNIDLTTKTNYKGEINKDFVRRMTPREWKRLQGYKESFVLPVADTHAYSQLGNSVSVPVVEMIAKNIKKVLDNDRKNGSWAKLRKKCTKFFSQQTNYTDA